MVKPTKDPKELLTMWRAQTVRRTPDGINLIPRYHDPDSEDPIYGIDLTGFISAEQWKDPSYFVPNSRGHLFMPYNPRDRETEQQRFEKIDDIDWNEKDYMEERELVLFLSDADLSTISNIKRLEIPSDDPAFVRLCEFERYARKCANAHGILKYGEKNPELSEKEFPRFRDKIETKTLTREEHKHIKNRNALYDFYWLYSDKMLARRMNAKEYKHLVETSVEDLVNEAINEKKKISYELRKNESNLVYQCAAAYCKCGTRFPESPIRANDLTLKLSNYRILKMLERIED